MACRKVISEDQPEIAVRNREGEQRLPTAVAGGDGVRAR
jgi:hypothetical protein